MEKDSLSKKNLSDLVVAKIRSYIESNNLRVGDRLPTEQEMCDKFGVSRVSVREATKALSFLGIIDAAPRRGLTVGPFDMERVKDILGFHFLIDNYSKELLLKTRMVIEVGSLQYAMKAISSEQNVYNKLIGLCDKLDQTKNLNKYIELDAEFHRTLVEVSGVDPLLAFTDIVNSFFAKFKSDIMKLDNNQLMGGAQIHRKIIESLHEGRLVEAEDYLREHLFSIEKNISPDSEK